MFKEDVCLKHSELGSFAVYSFSSGVSSKEWHLGTTYQRASSSRCEKEGMFQRQP